MIAVIGVAVAITVGVYYAKTRDGSKADIAGRGDAAQRVSTPQNQAKGKGTL